MAFFRSISSFGYCSLERYEGVSVDLLERRCISHSVELAYRFFSSRELVFETSDVCSGMNFLNGYEDP